MLAMYRCLQRNQASRFTPIANQLCARFSTIPSDPSNAVSDPPLPEPLATLPPPGHIDGGIALARLAKMAHALKDVLEGDLVRGVQMPELIAHLGRDVDEAYDLIRSALDKAGRPCTVEELGDRINTDIVPIPRDALNYKDYIRATNYRDDLERNLVSLNVFPPREAFLENEGLSLSRIQRKIDRKKIQLELAGIPEQVEDQKVDEHRELMELRPVSEEELERRKEYLEKSTTVEFLLQGYDTALLEVSRVHKVVKEGTTSSMRALVVIGNRKGTAGYGEGKSETAQHAIERACRDAKRNLLHLDLYQDRTIFHRVRGKFVCTRVTLWPKPIGSGITGNNNFSAIFQLFGIKDIGAKQHGPRSLLNAVKALFNTLSRLETPDSIAKSRGLDEIIRSPYNPRQRVKHRHL